MLEVAEIPMDDLEDQKLLTKLVHGKPRGCGWHKLQEERRR